MKAYIQSRLKGHKRWETHIPPYTNTLGATARERAEKQLRELEWYGKLNPLREYQIVEGQ